jgi:beta-glucosidase
MDLNGFKPSSRECHAPEDFLWAAGIENTFVPQTKPGHRALDEYELMGHYENWRVDLRLAKELGLNALRWGIPWHRVEPEEGRFDWSWTDKVIKYLVEEVGVAPIIDLMHYGCPLWLKKEFANKRFPDLMAAYSEAFAERYHSLIKYYTPLNEPIINSLMCGMRGAWPPYMRGDKGYVRIMLQIARGIVRSVERIRAVDPDAIMVYVEAAGLTRTVRDDLVSVAQEEESRGYLCFDLISGRFKHDHLLFSWLVRNGTNPDVIFELADKKVELDIVGLNFYPQWSTKQLYIDNRGQLGFRETEQEGGGFGELIRKYYDRFQRPIMITETSAVGSDEIRESWLEFSLETIKGLREEGIPVIGYTWFPLFTMIDWRYRFSTEPLENFYLELGLYHLNRNGPGPRWIASHLVERIQHFTQNSAEIIGRLKPQHEKV